MLAASINGIPAPLPPARQQAASPATATAPVASAGGPSQAPDSPGILATIGSLFTSLFAALKGLWNSLWHGGSSTSPASPAAGTAPNPQPSGPPASMPPATPPASMPPARPPASTRPPGSPPPSAGTPPAASTGTSTATTPAGTASSASGGPVGVPGNWQLTFDDEFNAPEQWGSVWSQMYGDHWKMNNVTTDPQNVTVTGGAAQLTLADPNHGSYMSTAKNDGGGGFEMGYGYAEARLFLPTSGGKIVGWPAWWIVGDNWPSRGEADVLEGLGGDATSNYHSSQGADNSGPIAGNWAGGWHTFGIDREPGENRIYWDGKLVRTYATHDGGAPEYLVLNYGSGGGPQVNGAAMKVDYVRVWKHASGT